MYVCCADLCANPIGNGYVSNLHFKRFKYPNVEADIACGRQCTDQHFRKALYVLKIVCSLTIKDLSNNRLTPF